MLSARKKTIVKQLLDSNKSILFSILKIVEFCGKQGLPLHDPRDDGRETGNYNPFHDEISTPVITYNQGNLTALFDLCVDSGNSKLGEHLERCKASQQSTSQNAQIQLLDCVKDYIQHAVVKDMMKDEHTYNLNVYGIKIIDIDAGSRNMDKLALIVRYVRNNKPVERLLEIFHCTEGMTGKILARCIIDTLIKVGLDPLSCRSQNYYIQGNMSRHVNTCATVIRKETLYGHQFHYAGYDLNESLCCTSKHHMIQYMVSAVRKLSHFFRASRKRQHKLEQVVGNKNKENRTLGNCEIKEYQLQSLFAEYPLRKHNFVEDFVVIYPAVVDCLDCMMREKVWDFDTVTNAQVLQWQIKNIDFMAAFQTFRHFSGYLKSMSVLLVGSVDDIISAYDKVNILRVHFVHIKENMDEEFEQVFQAMFDMSKIAGVDIANINITRNGNKKTDANVEESPRSYYLENVFLPFLEHLIGEFDARFNSSTAIAVNGFKLIPSHTQLLEDKDIKEIVDYHRQDLPSPNTFFIEIKLWMRFWAEKKKTRSLQDTLLAMNPRYFPNINRILCNLLALPITCTGLRDHQELVKRLHFFEERSSECEHACMALLFVHKEVRLDHEFIVRTYGKKNPRRMRMLNPLTDV